MPPKGDKPKKRAVSTRAQRHQRTTRIQWREPAVSCRREESIKEEEVPELGLEGKAGG